MTATQGPVTPPPRKITLRERIAYWWVHWTYNEKTRMMIAVALVISVLSLVLSGFALATRNNGSPSQGQIVQAVGASYGIGFDNKGNLMFAPNGPVEKAVQSQIDATFYAHCVADVQATNKAAGTSVDSSKVCK